jgi:CRISPR-associated protein Csm1
MDDNKRNLIYLAALLHDIGKFYQRADKPFNDKFNELSNYSKKIANDICPVNDKGKFGYQHVVWTNEFFERHKSIFDNVPGLKVNPYENKDDNNLVTFACNHHKPQTVLQAIVSLADGYSAGIDRLDAEHLEKIDYAGKKINWGKNRYKTIPLFSIFNGINKGKGSFAFPLEKLNVSNDIFPKKIDKKEDGVSEDIYKKLWENFISEFKQLPTDSFNGFSESLLFLLKKYTWSIPSNTMDMANVSLFEHLKTTAAFADSIYTYYLGNEGDFNWNASDKRLTVNEEKYPVILLGVDISGIQNFIYNIASSKAAKSLKGRSFYLQLLIDSMIQKIITHSDIQATLGHVIYSSGGKFYMILPNTEKVKSALLELKKEFEQELWKEHKGNISVNFGWAGFAYRYRKENNKWRSWIEIEGIKGEKHLNDLWKSVAEKINLDKNKPFQSVLLDKWKEFFDENNEKLKAKENSEICSVTGEELNENNRKVLDTDAEGNKVYVSKSVYNQVELGTALKDVDYLITFKDPKENSDYLNNRAHAHINVLGIDHYLFDKTELVKSKAEFRKISSADMSRVIKINDTENFLVGIGGQKISYGFLFYGGNEQAYFRGEDGNIIIDKKERNTLVFEKKREKTFESLTRIKQNNKDTETYLGVLRMDIDNLGNIFIKGFEKKQRSFAAYATLSFLLDLFFSGYLNTIRNNEKYRDWVNILYSGGDDVFAVGRWDKVIEFAREVQTSFAKFTGRDDITLSGGMATVRNKFPISKAADLAGDAEDISKKFNNGEKNAFTFFWETISWKNDFEYVEGYKTDFKDRIEGKEGKDMSKAILHRLMQFAQIKKDNEIKKKDAPDFKPDLSYKWNTAYYLKRFSQRHKENGREVHKEFIMNELMSDLFLDNTENRHYEKVAMACRWAELLIKLDEIELLNK